MVIFFLYFLFSNMTSAKLIVHFYIFENQNPKILVELYQSNSPDPSKTF